MQKGDGSFRTSSLISPILYLILQSVGIEIAKKYYSMRSDNISTYYSCNVLEKMAYYKHDHNEFFKEVNACASAFQHFIKTDISDFYQNINVNTLFSQVNEVVNKDKTRFPSCHYNYLRSYYVSVAMGNFRLWRTVQRHLFLLR